MLQVAYRHNLGVNVDCKTAQREGESIPCFVTWLFFFFFFPHCFFFFFLQRGKVPLMPWRMPRETEARSTWTDTSVSSEAVDPEIRRDAGGGGCLARSF